MLRVGLTGGIGAGKSTVATRLAEHGALLIDADAIAREVVEPGKPALAAIVAAFGEDVLDSEGGLNRQALAAKAFVDDESRTRLNGIMHPRIGARTGELIAKANPDAVVVHDIPLLVEGGLAPAYHVVIVVDAPEELRVRRLVHSRGMDEVDARARIAAQATESQRRAAADIWLDNSGHQDAIEAEVDALWADRLVPFEANVRLHRCHRYGSPRLVAPNPQWPAQAERAMARIALAAGEKALRVDHIGSTSVPGLVAKDIIDLQLTVESLADAEAVASALSNVGFPLRPRIDHDRPKPASPDVEQWRKRFHCGADPARPVNLHVRVAGTASWRFALLFRDWIRAEGSVRAEYAELKQRLAAEFEADDDSTRYAEAKEPWFDKAFTRAEEWAERTGWTP
ncbi:MAG: dephospho-CoA kinase [Haloechinothrix sp.]